MCILLNSFIKMLSIALLINLVLKSPGLYNVSNKLDSSNAYILIAYAFQLVFLIILLFKSNVISRFLCRNHYESNMLIEEINPYLISILPYLISILIIAGYNVFVSVGDLMYYTYHVIASLNSGESIKYTLSDDVSANIFAALVTLTLAIAIIAKSYAISVWLHRLVKSNSVEK